MKYDLSILIPARNEYFLSKTIDSLTRNIRGNTEILVGLDGEWSEPPLEDYPNVSVAYYPTSIGQRAMTNQLCRVSKAKYVMKIDAHCNVDEGFDVKMMAEMEDNLTMIPTMWNLHVFNWKCKKCGNEWYQSPTPKHCQLPGEKQGENPNCDSKDFERKIIWEPRAGRKNLFYRFDTDLHFQYHRGRGHRPEDTDALVETMSSQGSCFMLTREKYWEFDICDEGHGSWGQQGTEVACKTWLSGGRLVTNKKTWYAHMFRTQGGDFGFPYPISESKKQEAVVYSKNLWLNNSWPKQIRPLSWLIEKFNPLPAWHDPEGKEMLDKVNRAGEEFYKTHLTAPEISGFRVWKSSEIKSKGIIYYTDNQVPLKIGHAARKTIRRAGLPIVSTSLKPMDFGKNIHLKMERGYQAYFKQILTALENSDADIIYFCEHDWLYHPSHFRFTPTDKNTFYYNWNWWRVRSSDGLAVHYDTQMVPGLVGFRETLIDYYKQANEWLEKLIPQEGITKAALKVGFEPGTHKRIKFKGDFKVEKFESEYPILDIRHGGNLTSSKWSQDAFRNPKNAENWRTTDEIPGWGLVKGRFNEFIKDI